MTKAFTLIELLVAIAIITILAAILFPVFAKTKHSANLTQDTANLRQVGVATLLYVADHDDRAMPLVTFDFRTPSTPRNFGFYRWPWLLRTYTKSFEIFWSPLDANNQTFRDMRSNHPQNGYNFGLVPSWGYNQRHFSPDAPEGYAPIALTQTEDPAQTLLFGSSIWWTSDAFPKVGFYRLYPPAEWGGSSPLNGLSFGHLWPRTLGGKATVLWADSHAKPASIQQLQNPGLWGQTP